MSSATKPRLAVTLGDPAGIGLEVAAKALADEALRSQADLVVFGPSSEAWARLAAVELPPRRGTDRPLASGSSRW